MSGEVPEFDVSRILFSVSLRQSGNNGSFLKAKKKIQFLKKATKQSNGMVTVSVCTAESTLWQRQSPESAREEPAGIGFMLPPMDVSLDMPSTHAGGRRKVGE